MLKLALLVPGLLLLGLAPQPRAPGQAVTPVAAPVTAPPAAVPPNPGKPSADAVARAKKVYGYDCAMCHGETGNGKGDVAADMSLTLKNYTEAAALQDLSDPQIFAIIRDGKGKMPGEGPRLKPDDTWAMVALVHSFARK